MIRTAIIAAMPGELKPLVRGWRHEKRNRVDIWRWSYGAGEWVAACAGAGQNAATRALAAIEKDGPVASVVSVGWVGALSAAYEPGQAYRVAGVIDTLTGERFRVPQLPSPRPKDGANAGRTASPQSDIWLATSAKVADAAEKQRLASTYRAGLVDMEAAAIARLAGMRGVSFQCIKGVSDGVDDRLPDFNPFLTRDGQFQTIRFTFFALFHPGHWSALKQMGENSRKASRSMAQAVLELLDPQGSIHTPRFTHNDQEGTIRKE
ncbi:MAG TPA: nucleoside phosphorylase [Terracidiphilus sp.]|jgi:adenosylhomocysteine nucleosidase|nr:nucleoside phosphorylase [Terracidiphilus sp.]